MSRTGHGLAANRSMGTDAPEETAQSPQIRVEPGAKGLNRGEALRRMLHP
jgi:hypothetical protein